MTLDEQLDNELDKELDKELNTELAGDVGDVGFEDMREYHEEDFAVDAVMQMWMEDKQNDAQ